MRVLKLAFWPIPGTNTSLLLWHTWNNVEWDFDFCNDSYANYTAKPKPEPDVKKAPHKHEIHVNEPVSSVQILNASGQVVADILNPGNVIDISNLVRQIRDVHTHPSRRQGGEDVFEEITV